MKRLVFISLASLVLACSSQETRCRELSAGLERIKVEMERTQPRYCQASSILLYSECGGNKELFKALEEKYSELRNMHYEECDQVPVNIE